ncbi:MAG: hypothetical protein CME05_09915 [Gemmatimonadaceae bacterium]|nr:hypothetical protein [Gemmatimonadaceae bacterium]
MPDRDHETAAAHRDSVQGLKTGTIRPAGLVGQIGRDEFEHVSRVADRLMREIVSLLSEVIDMEIIEPEVETNNCYVMDG